MVMVVIDIMENISYDREFLLSLQFISVSMKKPDGLPVIRDVILDKVNSNKKPLGKLLNPPRHLPGGMDHGSDFRPSFGETGWRDRPCRQFSLSVDVQLNKAKDAWKPSGKKQQRCEEVKDTEGAMTQDLFNRVRGILNKLTPQKFQQLTKQVRELTIDTEARLKGVIDIIFEKAISEPNFSVVYAKMCHCFMELEVPSTAKPGGCVNFRRLLLNRCKAQFDEKLNVAHVEEKQLCKEELDHYRNKARKCSLGNIKFIGELFKLKMLTAATMDKCIISKLLITDDEDTLECLCALISNIGKDMDFEMAKPCMDQMEKIIKEGKTSLRIRFMLQDVLALQHNSWVPRRGDQGPKTIEQIHKDAEMEVQMEQLKIQQTVIPKESIRGSADRLGGGRSGGQGSYTPRQGRMAKGWNSFSISTNNKHIDTSRLSRMTKTRVLDINNQMLAPGNKGQWGKCSSSGTSVKPADAGSELGSRPASNTLNRFSDRQKPSSGSSLHSDRLLSPDNRVQARSTTENMKQDATPNPQTPTKPALTEDDVDKKSTAIIEEYLHINDMEEALQCVQELSGQLLFVFVRNGLESTLDCSAIARDHMGQLLYRLIKAGTLPIQQFYKGLQAILDVAEDMSTDIPHFWLYLAELITPMLHKGGIPMEQLSKEISKTLVLQGMAGNLLKNLSA